MTTPSGTSPYPPGELIGGCFRIVCAVAHGGMGAVYEYGPFRPTDDEWLPRASCAKSSRLDQSLPA
jgi:hypothetical protein